MRNRALKDLLGLARQEAAQQEQRFLGVEHVFLAMLTHDDTPAAVFLREQNVSIPYVVANVRRYTGRGDGRHLWAGHPHTPRLDVVLGIAYDVALEDGRGEAVMEADVWQAICEEGDSLATHVIRRMGATVG